MSKIYHFIVDTDSYSGNFERQLCSYMTGHIGDCGVGKKEAEEYLSNHQKVDNVAHMLDENYTDFYRPVEICPTPNVWNNGMGFHYTDGQEEVALLKYREEVEKYYAPLIIQAESYRGKNIANWTEEGIDESIKNYKKEIQHSLDLTAPPKYKAYQSIIIYFDVYPSEEVVKLMKERAYEYAEQHQIKITNFRIEEEK